MDLFQMMGISAPEAPAEKKEVKKAAPKKAEPKKAEEPKVKLPAKIIAGLWSYDLGGEGEKTITEVRTMLKEAGFVNPSTFNNVEVVGGNTVLIGLPTTSTGGATSLVTSASDRYVVECGEFRHEYDGEEGGKVSDVLVAFTENNPLYEGCGLFYNVAYGLFVPTGTDKPVAPEDEQEYKLVFNGEEIACLGKNIDKAIGLPEGESRRIKVSPLGDSGRHIVTLDVARFCSKGGTSTSAPKAETKKEVKFSLPVTLTFTHTADKQACAEMFNGKTEVSEEELQKWLESQYEEYTADKTEFMYFKKDNILEVRLKSSKRG